MKLDFLKEEMTKQAMAEREYLAENTFIRRVAKTVASTIAFAGVSMATLAVGLIGAPLIFLPAILGLGVYGGLAAAFAAWGIMSSPEFRKDVEALDESIIKRDQLIADAVKAGYTEDNLGPYESKIRRLTDEQKKIGQRLRRLINLREASGGSVRYLDNISRNERARVEAVIDAAIEGRLTHSIKS